MTREQLALFDGSAAYHAAETRGFDVQRFVESFEVLAEAEGGIRRLRELVLCLAAQGLLVPQMPSDGNAASLVAQLRRASEKTKADPKREAELRAGLEDTRVAPWRVPSSWRFLRLEQFSAGEGMFCDGDWVESKDQDPSGEIRLTQLADVGDGVWRDRSNRYMNRPTAEQLRCTFLEVGDILIARMPDPIGRACIFPGDERTCATVVDVAVLRIQVNFFDRRFVMMAVNSRPVRDAINRLIAGTTRQRVSRSNLAGVMVPVPPLAEQKRIVAKVDELMRMLDDLEAKQAKKREVQGRLRTAALDALTSAEGPEEFEAAWGRVAESWEVLFDKLPSVAALRDVILELAFTGRLIAPTRGDGQVEVLLRHIEDAWDGRKRKEALPDVSTTEGVPPSPAHWAWIRLGNLAEVVGGVTKGRNLTARDVRSYPYLRVANVQRGFLDLQVMKDIEIPREELPKYRLVPGDILFTEGGDWDKLGRSATWRAEIDPCIHQNHIFRARLVLRDLDPDWFSSFANSPVGRRYFENAAKQTTNLASINMTQLRNCPMPLPPLAEQKRIVAKVEHLMKLCDDLEAKLEAKEETASKLVEAVVKELVA